jgi:phenylacetate-coenzyme A ligase PaaK-like adenylate-forming protein
MGYEELRSRHWTTAMAHAPEMLERLDWPAERLAAHRRQALRQLLAAAQAKSPWHRRRLGHIDPDTFGEGDLAALPVMTKHDLMDHFDEIVTDRRLTLDRVENHLAGLEGNDAYLLGRYHAIASSGSSGRRGVFVFGWEAWAVRWLSNIRHTLLSQPADDGGRPLLAAMVAAGDATHGTSALTQTFSGPGFQTVRLPATLPLSDIVDGLNRARPDVLTGYPSALGPLVAEARAGRLRIRPATVVTTSEVLLASVRHALEETFGVPVTDVWSASEAGGLASSCPQGQGMHLSDDLVIVEPGEGCVYLTNLSNTTQPLIRYQLNDDVVVLDGPCSCGSAHRRIDGVRGRGDDRFVYGPITVSPLAFASPLARQRHVTDYQVRQTRRGAEVAVWCLGSIDLARIQTELTANLVRLGLADAEVVVRPVQQFERLSTGKLRRFVPLSA